MYYDDYDYDDYDDDDNYYDDYDDNYYEFNKFEHFNAIVNECGLVVKFCDDMSEEEIEEYLKNHSTYRVKSVVA